MTPLPSIVVSPLAIPVMPLEVSWVNEALGGSMAMALPVAVLVGLASFFSPCVLPLLPGYLSYATGLATAEVMGPAGEAPRRRGRVLLGTSLFVAGFALVFVSQGVLLGGLGSLLRVHRETVNIVAGIAAILLGLIFADLLPFGQRTVRVSMAPRAGIAAAPLFGIVFGLGWTPCIGPALGVVLSMAVNEATAARGALLALAYALGLGLPFLAFGLAFDRLSGVLGWMRRHQRGLQFTGGLLMIVVGVLLVTGGWDLLMGGLRNWAAQFGAVV